MDLLDLLATLAVASCLGCIPGAIAQHKGRSFVAWWLFGTALFILALPISLALAPLTPEQLAERARRDADARRRV